MSLDRAIASGRERRRRYYGAQAVDRSCRPGGRCPWCQRNRRYQERREMERIAYEARAYGRLLLNITATGYNWVSEEGRG